jgi:hypothetical protein
MAEGLQVLRYGTLVHGLTMWEALLTPAVQETLLKEVIRSLADRWNKVTATAIVSRSGGVVVPRKSLNRSSGVGEADQQLLSSLKNLQICRRSIYKW